jgi:hypothetical protein
VKGDKKQMKKRWIKRWGTRRIMKKRWIRKRRRETR